MAGPEQSAEDSAESLLAKAKKGAGAEGAREYVGSYLWARLWRSVTSIANCPPDINTLLMHKSEISTCMKLMQEMQLDLVNAEVAVKKIKDMFTARPQV